VDTNPLGRVAAGLLLEMVLQQDGSCECFELDSLCDQAVKELGTICVTQRQSFRRMVPGDIRREVVAQLNDLMRRGMLRFGTDDRSRLLIVRARDGIGPAVESMLSVIRSKEDA
jgi:hypothetical protein